MTGGKDGVEKSFEGICGQKTVLPLADNLW